MTSEVRAGTGDPARRLNPRVFDSDWLVLRGLKRAIASYAVECCNSGDRVLDLGCGSMPYRPFFESIGVTYLGADIAADVDIAISSSGLVETESGAADLVISIQVLEHVRDLDVYLSEARRVMADSGRMVLSTHGTWLYHPHPEDHRRWTRQGLVAEIEARGFEVLDVTAVVGPLAWTTTIRLTCYCFALKKIPLLGSLFARISCIILNSRAWVEDKLTPTYVINDNACVYVALCRKK
jgi:SAM-dependent methyltransferase